MENINPNDTISKLSGIGELLGNTWSIFKQRVWTLLLIILLGIVLMFVPALVLCGPAFVIGIFLPSLMIGLIIITAIPSVLIGLYFLVLFQIAFIIAVVNRDIGVIESFRRAKTRVSSFLWIGILMSAIIIGGFLLFIIPGIVLVVLSFFTMYVFITEDVRGMNAILKSKHYVKGQFFGVLLRLLVILLISIILNAIPVVGQLLSILLIPFSSIYYFLIYENLKAIKSGEVFSPAGRTGIIIIAVLGFLWIPAGIFFAIKSGIIKPSSLWTFRMIEKSFKYGKKGMPFNMQQKIPEMIPTESQPYISSVYPYLLTWGSKGNGGGQFDSPTAVAVDRSGNVYVGDSKNSRIQKFDSNGNFVDEWNKIEDGSTLSNVCGLAVDDDGNVYVVDGWNRVIKYNSNGELLLKWGGFGTEGDKNFFWAKGIAVDRTGNIYVVDSYNSFILKFDSNGKFLKKWGTKGIENGRFNTPNSVAVDDKGNVYVTDIQDSRIQKFDSNGKFLAKWGSKGEFNQPYGIAADSDGNVYVTDYQNSRIQKFDSHGNFIAKWGSSGTGDGEMIGPYGVAVYTHGVPFKKTEDIFVVDSGNNRVLKLTADFPLHKIKIAKKIVKRQPERTLPSRVVKKDISVVSEKKFITNYAYGKVVDSKNNPLQKATVKFIQNGVIKARIYTDRKGEFKTEELPAGIYKVKAWKSGYQTIIKKGRIEKGRLLKVNFILGKWTLD